MNQSQPRVRPRDITLEWLRKHRADLVDALHAEGASVIVRRKGEQLDKLLASLSNMLVPFVEAGEMAAQVKGEVEAERKAVQAELVVSHKSRVTPTH
jgi:hypothetical protein